MLHCFKDALVVVARFDVSPFNVVLCTVILFIYLLYLGWNDPSDN